MTKLNANNYNHEAFYKPKGRIGRVRYMAYGSLFGLVLLAVIFVTMLGVNFLTLNHVSGDTIMIIVFFIAIFATLILWYGAVVLSIRRLNDLGKSGWFVLTLGVPFVGFLTMTLLLCVPGTSGENAYGLPAKPPTPIHYALSFCSIVLTASSLLPLWMHGYQYQDVVNTISV